jgi:hypothetical protein
VPGYWPVRRRALVNLTTGKAFRGVLWAKRGPLLILRDAVLIENGQQVPLDGEVVIERPQVEFIQLIPAEVGP